MMSLGDREAGHVQLWGPVVVLRDLGDWEPWRRGGK